MSTTEMDEVSRLSGMSEIDEMEQLDKFMPGLSDLRQKARTRAETGDYTIKMKLVMGQNVKLSENTTAPVRDMYFVGAKTTISPAMNIIKVVAGDDGGFNCASIVYQHPIAGQPDRSLYFTFSGSVYEAPTELEYSGIPLKYLGNGYMEERQRKLEIMRASRDRTLAKWKAGTAYVIDFIGKWEEKTREKISKDAATVAAGGHVIGDKIPDGYVNNVKYHRSDFHDSARFIGNMMAMPCLVYDNGDSWFRWNSSSPILHALKTDDGKFVFIVDCDAVIILDKEPEGNPVEFNETINELLDGEIVDDQPEIDDDDEDVAAMTEAFKQAKKEKDVEDFLLAFDKKPTDMIPATDDGNEVRQILVKDLITKMHDEMPRRPLGNQVWATNRYQLNKKDRFIEFHLEVGRSSPHGCLTYIVFNSKGDTVMDGDFANAFDYNMRLGSIMPGATYKTLAYARKHLGVNEQVDPVNPDAPVVDNGLQLALGLLAKLDVMLAGHLPGDE
jgi:hypothetical protein